MQEHQVEAWKSAGWCGKEALTNARIEIGQRAASKQDATGSGDRGPRADVPSRVESAENPLIGWKIEQRPDAHGEDQPGYSSHLDVSPGPSKHDHTPRDRSQNAESKDNEWPIHPELRERKPHPSGDTQASKANNVGDFETIEGSGTRTGSV